MSVPKLPKVTRKKISDYLPDGHNANLGSERGLQMLENSLHEVGVGRSIVADKNGKIPAGNKTIEAAVNAGFEDVIEIEDDGKTLIVHKRTDWDLDDPTGGARKYAYYDNRVSQISLNWDANVIAQDIEAGLDLGGMFTQPEIDYIQTHFEEDTPKQEPYTRKIDIPLYEPQGEKPKASELFDASAANRLIYAILENKDLSEDEREFLIIAARRHTVLNFAKIADFYAHSSAEVQRLMEDSALVIIDFNRAIELGYVKLTGQVAELVGEQTDE